MTPPTQQIDRDIFIIQRDLTGAGFGACFLAALNLARYAESRNMLPVVNFDRDAKNAFFDPSLGTNMWEQYFEPVAGYSYADIEGMLADPSEPLSSSALHTLPLEACEKIHLEDQNSIFTYPYGRYRKHPPLDLPAWYAEQRSKARETVRKYVRVKPHIQKKVDDFYVEHLQGHFVLGLHIRGTDLHYVPPVSPAEYFPHIDGYLEREPGLRIFLATDQVQYADLLEERYGDRLKRYDCIRSTDSVAPFDMKGVSPYKKGEDVLIDILLLSKSDFIIKGASHVGELALYFNDQLECLDLSLDKTKAFGQEYGKGWSFLATKPAWSLIGKTDLRAVPPDSASQTLLQRMHYKLQSALLHLVVGVKERVSKLIGR